MTRSGSPAGSIPAAVIRLVAVWSTTSAAALAVICVLPPRAEARLSQADLAELVEGITQRDRDGKHTAPTPEAMDEIYRGLLEGGARGVSANVRALVGMLVQPGEPGKGEDYKARYVLHALTTHVTRPGMERQREAVTGALVSSLDAAKAVNVKQFVVAELQFLHDPAAVRPLGRLLRDEALCDHAARALADIGLEGAAELRGALDAGGLVGTSRLSVVQALGDLRDAGSVDALMPLLSDPAGDVRLAAAAALGRIADARAVAPLMRVLDASKGFETIKVADACFVLAENLIKAGSRDEAFRVFRHMWGALADRDEPQISHAVIEGLASGLSSETTAELVRRLAAGDSATRAAILHVLGRRGDPDAFPAVAAAMADEDIQVRLVAAAAIGPVGREMAVPLLIKALPGQTPQAKHALHTALVNVPGEGSGRAIASGLAGVPDGADAAEVRIALVNVLADRGSSEGARAVFDLFEARTGEADLPVRLAAVKALAKLADGSFAPSFAATLLKARHAEEFKALEDALMESCRRIGGGGRAQLDPILPALDTDDVRAKCALLRVAGRIGAAESIDVLVTALEDRNEEVRDTAMRALSEFPSDRPAATVLEIAKSTDNLRHQVLALRGYVRMAEKKRDNKEKLAMLGDAMDSARRPDEKKLILGILGRIRTVASLKAVVPFLDDPAVTEEAGRAALDIARKLGNKQPDVIRDAMAKVVANARSDRLKRDAAGLMKKMKGAK